MADTRHDVPLKTRIIQITCAIVWCLLAAGPVFGFAALKPVLISEGVYSGLCEVGDEVPCVKQDLKLNSMFTLAAVITNITSLLVGSILDNYGPRVSGIIGAVLIFVASLILKYSATIEFMDGYKTGYTLLLFGGPFVFISCFQLANTFPHNSGLILLLLTGAFDSSSALFLVYRLVYQNNIVENLSISKFFTIYLVVPVFIFICQVTVMPKDSYKTVNNLAKIGELGIDETDETTLLLSTSNSHTSAKSVYEQEQETRLTHKSGGIYGVCHDMDLVPQLKTPWFILMCLFTTIQMLRINYFLATVRSQEEYLFNGVVAIEINQFFDLALPLGGIASIPFIGLLLDNFTTLSVLTILTTVSVIIGICGILKFQFLAYLGILMLVVYRPFYYTLVSDYCAKVFGFKTFGTIYGAIICFSGCLNLLQTLFDNLTHFTFNMNPIPVNSTLTLLTFLIGFSLISFVISQEKLIKKKQIIQEAESATVSEMPQ